MKVRVVKCGVNIVIITLCCIMIHKAFSWAITGFYFFPWVTKDIEIVWWLVLESRLHVTSNAVPTFQINWDSGSPKPTYCSIKFRYNITNGQGRPAGRLEDFAGPKTVLVQRCIATQAIQVSKATWQVWGEGNPESHPYPVSSPTRTPWTQSHQVKEEGLLGVCSW